MQHKIMYQALQKYAHRRKPKDFICYLKKKKKERKEGLRVVFLFLFFSRSMKSKALLRG